MAIVYMALARFVIPLKVMKYVQGAGFNIVYIVFFAHDYIGVSLLIT